MKTLATVTTFNLDELCTDQQARDLRGFLNYYPWAAAGVADNGQRVGGGVRLGDAFSPFDPNLANSAGIFLPSWVSGPGGFPEPNGVDPVTGVKLYWLSVRLENGLTSNVGLMRRALYGPAGSPTTPEARKATMAYWMTYFGTN